MPRRTRPNAAAILALCVVVALASLGLGYAQWTERLKILGTVNTGSLNLRWLPSDEIDCIDRSDPSNLNHAQVTAYRDGADDGLVHFVVTNGYPMYWARCNFEWTNGGTVAAQLDSITLNGTPISSGVEQPFDLAGDGQNDLVIKFTGGAVPPTLSGQGGQTRLRIDVLSGAPQGTPLVFTVRMHFIQWNAP